MKNSARIVKKIVIVFARGSQSTPDQDPRVHRVSDLPRGTHVESAVQLAIATGLLAETDNPRMIGKFYLALGGSG